MDLNLFATQVISKAPLSGSSSALLGGNGLNGALGNFDFLNALLGNIEQGNEIKTSSANENTKGDASTEGLKKEAVDLTLLQLALLGQDADKNLDEKLAELKIESLAKTKNNRVDQLTKLINHLTSGLPQEFSGETQIEDLVSRLNKRLETLESSLDAFRNSNFSDEDAPFKLLIATGLNPAQLTKITNRIEEVEAKLGRELTVEDLIAGVGNIIPTPGESDHEFSSTDALAILTKKTDTDIAKEKDRQEEDIINDISSASLDQNNQTINNSQHPSGPTKSYSVQDLLNMIAPNKVAPAPDPTIQPTVGDTTILPEDGITQVPRALSNADFQELFGAKNNVGIKNIAHLVTANISPDAAIPKVTAFGDFILPTNWMDTQTSQQALSEVLGYDVQTGTPFTTTMQAVHTSTAAQSAAQMHPGTNMVAAQMTKSVQNGDTRNIILQLDPPELGRVEIRMEFGADNKVKAYMVVEKPETLLMLQRDMAALDRALQDAGMDTGSDSLNYEMAEDNYGFGKDKNGHNGNSGTKNANHYNDDEIEIIETNMDWNVDPTTGHVHYNIIA